MNPQRSTGQQQDYQNYAQYPTGGPVQTRRNNQITPQDRDGGLGAAISTAIGYLVLVWTVFLVNEFTFGEALNSFGVCPRETLTLWGILTAPLLHVDYGYVMANFLSGALFAGLIAMSSKRLFWQVTFLITVADGGLTWLVGGVNTVHIGASGLICGWPAFLIVRGFVNRRVMQIILGIILASMYSGLIWGVLPTQATVSWQIHLSGGLAGIWAVVIFKRGHARG